MHDKRSVLFIDTTLRDGEQAAGVHFSLREKIRIAAQLEACGITVFEAGIPAMGREAVHEFKTIIKRFGSMKGIAWSRASKKDLEACLRADAENIHVSLPASDIMLEKKLGWSRIKALDIMADIMQLCSNEGVGFSVGAEDASRADAVFLKAFFDLAVQSGAYRLRYADTLGIEEPLSVYEKMKHYTAIYGSLMEYHAHNDLGLASANALSAVRAGCAVSLTVCGLGERSGNAALEQLAASVELILGQNSGIKLDRLPELCAVVAAASRRPVPPDKPIIGEKSFCHESGIHVDGLIKCRTLYTGIDPACFGRDHQYLPGPYSGSAALKKYAEQYGHRLDDIEVRLLQDGIKKHWSSIKSPDPWIRFETILKKEFV